MTRFYRERFMNKRYASELSGTSDQIVELKKEIERVARSDAKVLITGESGVGKEVVAREIHARSLRANRPFVPVNCAGLPETLLESELFGHVKGSFTGAYRDKPGKLEAANGGTVLLDEVGEMTLRMQGLLLRFLETGELQKVGSERAMGTVNVRILAATNRSLTGLIKQGLFREDLFYRLNVIHLILPPLRERRDDIPAMVRQFVTQYSQNNGHRVRGITPDAVAMMSRYAWPGNVRELQNVIERLVVVGQRDVIDVDDLPAELRNLAQSASTSSKPEASVVDQMYTQLTAERQSFWTTVYPMYMQREITKSDVRNLVRKGLEESRGNYRIMLRLFNMEPTDYKKFLNFLRKHQCQLPFKEFRQVEPSARASASMHEGVSISAA
jgi:transcriptional regulator with PAS, ATPase and Fis domain